MHTCVRSPGQESSSLAAYLRQIDQYPLLTKEDEARLSQSIALGRVAEGRVQEAKERPGEQRSLREAVAAGSVARNGLVEANLRLVVSVAKRFRYMGLPLADLIGFGNLGLFRAVDKFDGHRGYRFSTYATWWIRSTIKRGAQTWRDTVHLPTHVTESLDQIARTRGYLEVQLGRAPTDDDLAGALEVSPSRLRELQSLRVPRASLSQPVHDSQLVVGDTVDDPRAALMFDEVLRSILVDRVTGLLSILDRREREVVNLRYGFAGHRSHTLEEIGNRMGLSRERVRQIERGALSKLRHPSVGADDWKELVAG